MNSCQKRKTCYNFGDEQGWRGAQELPLHLTVMLLSSSPTLLLRGVAIRAATGWFHYVWNFTGLTQQN